MATRTAATDPTSMTTVAPTITNITGGMPTTDTSLLKSTRPWSITQGAHLLFVTILPSFTAGTLGASTVLVHSVFPWQTYATVRLNVGKVTEIFDSSYFNLAL